MDFSENFVPPKKGDKVDYSVWWTDRDGSLVIEVQMFGGFVRWINGCGGGWVFLSPTVFHGAADGSQISLRNSQVPSRASVPYWCSSEEFHTHPRPDHRCFPLFLLCSWLFLFFFWLFLVVHNCSFVNTLLFLCCSFVCSFDQTRPLLLLIHCHARIWIENFTTPSI